MFVRPSQVGVVAKWLNVGSHKLCCTLARDYLVDAKDLYESPKNAGAVGKNCVFFDRSWILRLKRLYTAENLCPSATLRYAVSSTTLVVVKSDDHSYSPVDINNVDGTGVC